MNGFSGNTGNSNDGMMNYMQQQQQQQQKSQNIDGLQLHHHISSMQPQSFAPTPNTNTASTAGAGNLTLPQQQQQQHPQIYSYGMPNAPMPGTSNNSNINNAIMGGGSGGGGDQQLMRRFDPIHIAQQQQQQLMQQKQFEDQKNYTNNIDFDLSPKKRPSQELLDDFKAISNANLLDDETILDDLYRLRKVFNTKNLGTSYIISTYLGKYDDFVQKYPSLTGWLIFTVSYIRSNGDKPYRLLGQKRAARLTASVNPKFALQPRSRNVKRNASTAAAVPDAEAKKRKMMEAKMMEEKKVKSKNGEDANRRNARLANHPFLSCEEYKSWSHLFRIGEFMQYLVPGDFGELNMRCAIGNAKRFITGEKSCMFRAINVTFSVPVLSKISVVMMKHMMAKCTDFDSIDKVLIDMCDERITNSYEFDFGVLKSQPIVKVKDGSTYTIKTLNQLDQKYLFFYVCNSFSTFLYGTSTLQHKGYASEFFELEPEAYTSETDEVQRSLHDYLDENCQAVFDKYDEDYPYGEEAAVGTEEDAYVADTDDADE